MTKSNTEDTNSGHSLADYLSLTKPRINALVLVTTFIGAWMASPGTIDAFLLVKIILGTGLTVAGASAFNCYQEAEIDARMPRTMDRPIPAGRIPEHHALILALLCALTGLGTLILFVNLESFILAALALLFYTPIYTMLKGVTSLSTIIGAIPGALPPMIGWAGVTGTVNLPAVILFLIMFVWQPPHFLALALFRKKDYDDAGLAMLPVEMNDRAAVRQIIVYSAALLPLSLLPVHYGMAGTTYFILALVFGTGFLLDALRGLNETIRSGPTWSRRLFAFSILHLTVLFAGFLIDSGSGGF